MISCHSECIVESGKAPRQRSAGKMGLTFDGVSTESFCGRWVIAPVGRGGYLQLAW